MKRCAAYLLPVCLGIALSGTVRAENLQLEEIIIKGEKESPREESLTIKEVRESPARDMGEALKQVEGVSCVRKGAIANDVVLRGFQKDNINVLVDGVRIHGACPSRMDPPAFHYDFAEVEQVKVVKGPYDLENPGGVGGMVDARTKRPGSGLGGEFNATYGSYDSVNTALTGSYGTQRYDILGGYAFKYSGVPESGDGRKITEILGTGPNRYRPGALDSTAYQINTGWLKLGMNPTANSRTEVGYTYQDADHVLYPYLKMDAEYDRTHRLNWTYRAANLTPVVREVKLQAYWDRVNHLMNDVLRASSTPGATVTRPFSMQTDARTQVVGAKLSTGLAVGPGALTAGADYYNRNWDAQNVRAMFTPASPYTLVNMIPDVYVDNFGMYLGYELPLAETVTMKAGMRGDLTWVRADKANTLTTSLGNSRDYGEFGGNLQLTWRPVREVELFTGFGRGSRPPDPQELYISLPGTPTWSGNPNLKPTVNHQFDIGAKYATDRFYVNAAMFYGILSDYVNFEQSGASLKRYANVNATMWGAELGSQVSLPLDLFLRGSLSYTEGENTDGHRPLSEIPPLKGILSVRYDNGTWFAEVLEHFASRQDRVDRNLNEQETGGWMTTDLKAGATYGALSVYAGVNNLLDKYYFSHLSYLRDPFVSGVGFKVPENGRNFYLTAAYRF